MNLRSGLAPLAIVLVAGCSHSAPLTAAAPRATIDGPAADAAPSNEGLDAVQRALAANDCVGAKQGAAKVLSSNPKRAEAHFYAGTADECLGEAASAEKHYRDAIALAPTLVEAATNLTLLLIDQKRGADAVAALKPVVARAGSDPVVQTDLGAALAASGDHAGAATAYERSLKAGGGPGARLAYADELVALGKKDDAVASLREGVAAAGNDRDQLAAFGRGLAKAGAFHDAVGALDKALAIKASADLITYRGIFHRSLKDLPAARADLEAATKQDPTFAPAFLYLGEVLEDLKKPAEARRAYESAVRLAGEAGPGKRAHERLGAMKK